MTRSPAVLILLALGVGLLVLAVLVGLLIARSPLKQRTVDRFAARQELRLVAANATHTVGALLLTHRWRRAGLVVGLLAGVVWSLQYGSLTLHFLAGFLGWFAGAVIAEWRISGLDRPSARRVADLQPRRVSSYVTPGVLAVTALTALAVVVVASIALARAGATPAWFGWMAYALGVVAVLYLTARAVVGRPSGFADADVREADDALRCHGLTVLAGSGIAASYPAMTGLAVQAAYPGGVPGSADPGWSLLIMIGLIVLGWWVAVGSPSPRRRRPASAPHRDDTARDAAPA